MRNSFLVVKMFEEELAEYTGAKYVVTVNSGTSALSLAFQWWVKNNPNKCTIHLPEETYRSVFNMAYKASMVVLFDKKSWSGVYPIKPTNIWDCALRLAPKMYRAGTVQVLSFHPQKPLALSSGGGAILHDDPEADKWYRLMRFDGRTEGVSILEDEWPLVGDHCYMFPNQAAEAWHKLDIYRNRYPEKAPDAEQPKYENLNKKWRG